MNGQNIEKMYNILSKSQGLKSLYLQYKLTVILLMARKKNCISSQRGLAAGKVRRQKDARH